MGRDSIRKVLRNESFVNKVVGQWQKTAISLSRGSGWGLRESGSIEHNSLLKGDRPLCVAIPANSEFVRPGTQKGQSP